MLTDRVKCNPVDVIQCSIGRVSNSEHTSPEYRCEVNANDKPLDMLASSKRLALSE